MKKIIYVILMLFIGMGSVNALDCPKCNQCDSTSSDYETCIETYCDSDVTLCAVDDANGKIESNTYSKVQCGDIVIPSLVPKLVHTIVIIIQIAIPIIIIIFGMLDMAKAVSASKEDDIKKGQKMLIKRIITGVIVFLLFVVVKTVIGLVAGDSGSMWSCVDCVINNKCG